MCRVVKGRIAVGAKVVFWVLEGLHCFGPVRSRVSILGPRGTRVRRVGKSTFRLGTRVWSQGLKPLELRYLGRLEVASFEVLIY